MSRDFFGIEKGLDIYAENGSLLVRVMSGTASPDGLLDQSSAPVGSLYSRSGVGELYQKIANNGNAADWLLASNAAVTVGKWRGGVKALTGGVVSVGVRNLTTTPFSDDDAPLLTSADFVVGDFVISNAFVTPVLLKVTAVSSPNVTFALADYPILLDDTFIIDNYLPDPAAGESKAIANYNGTIMVKVADFDWSLATGVNLSTAYVAAAGNPLASDTLEVAIQKLDGNMDAVNALTGVAQTVTNLGAWTAPVDLLFIATSTVKALFQRVGELLLTTRGVSVVGITSSTMVDQVPVATVKACKWFVTAFEIATPANAVSFEVLALNNGTLVDDNLTGKLKTGSVFNLTTLIDVSGGNMRLMIASTTAGVTVTARRVEIVKTVI